MSISVKTSIGSIVALNYKTAEIFNAYGIDFCCKGNKSIEEVVKDKNLNLEELIENLDGVLQERKRDHIDFKQWPSDLLIDYIEKVHHRYIVQKTPIILQYLEKVCTVHGTSHPELFLIKDQFSKSAKELSEHMKKEEIILFPYIRQIIESSNSGKFHNTPPFGSVQNPISMMMEEHDIEGERFRQIASLSNSYISPSDSCHTYKVCFAMLKEFEEDLHLHIHLENNILFPKAAELEKALLTSDTLN